MRDGHAYLNRNAQRIATAMIEDADRLGERSRQVRSRVLDVLSTNLSD